MVSIQKSLKPQFLREEKKSELYEHLHMCELKAHAMQLQNPTLIKKNEKLPCKNKSTYKQFIGKSPSGGCEIP